MRTAVSHRFIGSLRAATAPKFAACSDSDDSVGAESGASTVDPDVRSRSGQTLPDCKSKHTSRGRLAGRGVCEFLQILPVDQFCEADPIDWYSIAGGRAFDAAFVKICSTSVAGRPRACVARSVIGIDASPVE